MNYTNQSANYTTQSAIDLIKKAPKGSFFALHVRVDAPMEGKEDRVFRDGCATYLMLTRRQALKMVTDMLTNTLESMGGRIPITTSQGIGSMANETTYWIGL